MTKFDFNDGNGPVPAQKHPNGGGWVADTATVADTAYVGRNAKVYGNSWVCVDAKVFGDTKVYENARVYENAKVFGNATVSEDKPSKERPEKDRIFINGKWYVEE